MQKTLRDLAQTCFFAILFGDRLSIFSHERVLEEAWSTKLILIKYKEVLFSNGPRQATANNFLDWIDSNHKRNHDSGEKSVAKHAQN